MIWPKWQRNCKLGDVTRSMRPGLDKPLSEKWRIAPTQQPTGELKQTAVIATEHVPSASNCFMARPQYSGASLRLDEMLLFLNGTTVDPTERIRLTPL